MVGSIAASVLTLALFAVVIGGVFSDPTLSVNGWPGDRSGAVGTASPDRSPTPGRSPSRRPTPSVTLTSSPPTPAATRTATPSRQPEPVRSASRRPSPTRAPSTEPSTEPSTGPVDETAPPGKLRTPPGRDPDRVKGPKK